MRTITIALNIETGMRIYTEDLFSSKTKAHEIRKKFDPSNSPYECLECQQRLRLADSAHGNIYLAHYPNSLPCILKNENAPKSLIEEVNRKNRERESPRHIYLKNLLAKKLNQNQKVSNIRIDDYWLVNNEGGRRKPDVYCELKSRKFAFEIQLSPLSINYIMNRYEFYYKENIRLIWIFDRNSLANQKQFKKDIKYLSEHQNLFEICESDDKYLLYCNYKQPFSLKKYGEYIVCRKWKKKPLKFEWLKFDSGSMAYFYNEKTDLERVQYECAAKNREIDNNRLNYAAAEAKIRELESQEKELEKNKYQLDSKISTCTSKYSTLKELCNLSPANFTRTIMGFIPYYWTKVNIKAFQEYAEVELDKIKVVMSKMDDCADKVEKFRKAISFYDSLEDYIAGGKTYKYLPHDEKKWMSFIEENYLNVIIAKRSPFKIIYPALYKRNEGCMSIHIMQVGKNAVCLYDYEDNYLMVLAKLNSNEHNIQLLEAEKHILELEFFALFKKWAKDELKALSAERVRLSKDFNDVEDNLNTLTNQIYEERQRLEHYAIYY